MLNLNAKYNGKTFEDYRNQFWEVEKDGKHYILLQDAEIQSTCSDDKSVIWAALAVCKEDTIEDGFAPSYTVYWEPVEGWEKLVDNNDYSNCCDWDSPADIEEYHVVRVNE